VFARALLIASLLWPVLLAAAWWSEESGHALWLGRGVYTTCGRICHQKPERSFHTAGVQWPVCGRCAGLYLAAPFGAAAALAVTRRRVPSRAWFLAAALPTAATLVMEFLFGMPMTSLARALAALPLGAAVTWFMMAAIRSEPARSSKLTSA